MSQPAVHNPYLGSRISLISKAKIRYEGILYAIDTDAMTVALTKVRSFGTENRCPDRPIGPRDETFEYIIFRGTDICDLNVCDLPNDRFPQDPAILSATTQPPAPIGQQPNAYIPSQGQSPAAGTPDGAEEKDNHDATSDRDRRNQRTNQNYENRRGNQNNQRNNFQNRTNAKGAKGTSGPTQFKEDFDFESANAEFENIRKELFENLKISTGNDKPEEPINQEEEVEVESGEILDDDSRDCPEYYNKANSFFDNISCESTDPHGERITRSAERKLNSETFGITGNNRNYNRRGGYNRGRGNRGHRGGYNNRGGGHRGGYNRGEGGDTRNWRQGHDNRNNQDNQQQGQNHHNNRNNSWKRGGNMPAWAGNDNNRNNNRGHWRGGGGNRGGNRGWNKNRQQDEQQQQGQGQQQQRNNRNNRNREWVDYEYDVSKARQEQQS